MDKFAILTVVSISLIIVGAIYFACYEVSLFGKWSGGKILLKRFNDWYEAEKRMNRRYWLNATPISLIAGKREAYRPELTSVELYLFWPDALGFNIGQRVENADINKRLAGTIYRPCPHSTVVNLGIREIDFKGIGAERIVVVTEPFDDYGSKGYLCFDSNGVTGQPQISCLRLPLIVTKDMKLVVARK